MKKQIVSFALIFALLVTLFAGIPIEAFAAETVTSPSTSRIIAVNFSDTGTYSGISGATRNSKVFRTGDATARWNKHKTNNSFTAPVLLSNWSSYKYLEFWVYSEKITNQTKVLNINCPDATDGSSYFQYKITVDYEGWNHYYIPFSDFTDHRSPSWKNITGITFAASGWGLSPEDDSDIYIDSFYLIKTDTYTHLDKCIANFSRYNSLTSYSTAQSNLCKTGSGSALWNNTTTQTSLKLPDVPKNMSGYEYLHFYMYSKTNTGQKIMLMFSNKSNDAGESVYFNYFFTVDYTGWKEFTVPLSSFGNTRGAKWTAITGGEFRSNGWSMTPQTSTYLAIDNIYLLQKNDSNLNFTQSGIKYDQVNCLFDPDNTSLINKSTGLSQSTKYKGSCNHTASFKGGAKFALLENNVAFYDTFQVDVYCEGGKSSDIFNLTIECKTGTGRTLTMQPQQKNCWSGKTTFQFELRSLVMGSGINTMTHVNLHNITAIHASCASGTFYFDRIYVYRTHENFNLDTDFIPPSFFSSITDEYLRLFCGDQSSNDTSVSQIKTKINTIDTKCTTNMESFDASRTDFPWEPTAGKSLEAQVSSTYSKICDLAYGYATYGSKYYHDSAVLSNIKTALNFMYVNYYGFNFIWDCSEVGNWSNWEINIPERLVLTLCAIKDSIPENLIDRYLAPMEFCCRVEFANGGGNMANMALFAMVAQALRGNAAELLHARRYTFDLFRYTDDPDYDPTTFGENFSDQGYFHDGSYQFHKAYNMTTCYGVDALGGPTNMLLILKDSVFRMPMSLANNLYEWVFNTYVPFAYRNYGLACGAGRGATTGSGNLAYTQSMLPTYMSLAKCFTGEKQTQLYSLVAAILKYKDLSRYANFADIKKALEIKKGTTGVTPYQLLGYTKVFGKTDRVVQHNLNDYCVALALTSTRVGRFECINYQNTKGWYTGEGMVYVYTPDSLIAYTKDFFNNCDSLKMPGTTVTTAPRQEIQVPIQPFENCNKYDFAGGVSQGQLGVAANHFGGYTMENYTTTLDTKKAYFMFDDELVCLGSGISCSDNQEVITVIDNRKVGSSTQWKINNTAVSPTANTKLTNANTKTAYIANMGGYYFPNAVNLNYRKYVNTDTFDEMWISHGNNASSSNTYSYVELPGMTADQTEAYAKNPDISIVTNTANVQAVKDNSTGATGYVFWTNGSCGNVTADRNCTALITNKNGKLKISVSDPSQKEASVTLKISGMNGYTLSSKDSAITTSTSGGTITVTAKTNNTNTYGATYTCEYEFTGSVTVTLDNQGATSAGTASVSAKYGSAMPAITPPTKTDYAFFGYFTGTNGTGIQYYKADGTGTKNSDLVSNTTLYALWKRYGDANLDGNVDSSDALLALQHSVEITTLTGDGLFLSDVNLDKTVNANDALLILQRSIDKISKLPVK